LSLLLCQMQKLFVLADVSNAESFCPCFVSNAKTF
jgi:hypothetical protein